MLLKEYLFLMKQTVKEFAKQVDCAPNYISAINSGRKKPGKKLAKSIFHATCGRVQFEENTKDK